MEDETIIGLYWNRSQQAISETQNKYGRMLRSIAYGILKSLEDAQECENDTYLKTWQLIPPKHPDVFSAFLSKITRNLSLDRYDQEHAQKRGGGEIPLLLDELSECIPDDGDISDQVEGTLLSGAINRFLAGLKPEARNIFMRRYWFGDTVREIAEESGSSQSKVKMSLLRSRNDLKLALEKEGFFL